MKSAKKNSTIHFPDSILANVAQEIKMASAATFSNGNIGSCEHFIDLLSLFGFRGIYQICNHYYVHFAENKLHVGLHMAIFSSAISAGIFGVSILSECGSTYEMKFNLRQMVIFRGERVELKC